MKSKTTVIFELKASYYCNLGCHFCLFSERRIKQKPISSIQINSILSLIKKKYPKIDYFIISGGEPAIRSDFWRIWENVDNILKPNKLILHTNGLAKRLLEKSRLFSSDRVLLFFSYHTLSPETHYLFTQTKSYKQINENLDALLAQKVKIFANTVIMKPNQNEIEKIGKQLCEKGVTGWEIRFPFGTGHLVKKYPWIMADDFEGIADQINQLLKTYHQKIDFLIHPSVPCVLAQNKVNNRLLSAIWTESENTLRKNKDFLNGQSHFVFMDPRLRVIEDTLQQKAINQGEVVFERIDSCKSCPHTASCMGIPKEFLNR